MVEMSPSPDMGSMFFRRLRSKDERKCEREIIDVLVLLLNPVIVKSTEESFFEARKLHPVAWCRKLPFYQDKIFKLGKRTAVSFLLILKVNIIFKGA